MNSLVRIFPVVIISLITSCGPEEGPLGIHPEDHIIMSKNLQGTWIRRGMVQSVGDDWVSTGEQRYTASDLAGVKISCPHN